VLLGGLLLNGACSFCANHPIVDQGKQQAEGAGSFDDLAKRAEAAMDAGNTADAIRLYDQATALRPTWSEGWWYLGTIAFDAGQYSKAQSAFVHFVYVEHAQPGPGFGMLGLSEFELHQYQRALDALERGWAVGLGTNSAFIQTVLYHDGMLNSFFGFPEVAVQRLTRVADMIAAAHPEGPRDAVFADSELIKAFGVAALRMRKLPSEVPADQIPLVENAGRAQALIALQDRVAARAEFEQLVSRFPSQPGVHYMHGIFLLKEDPPLAAGEFHRELEISPSSDVARIQLAFEYLRTNDYEQGLKFARQAIALSPGNFAAHVVCGRLLLAMGNTNHAVTELRTAVKLAPGSPDARFALAQALVKAGEKDEAAREFAEFQRIKAQLDSPNRPKE
jgi:tetratricopeptide (TPR) repeat protein